MQVTCPNCGLELIEGARFCRRCGIALGIAAGVEDIIETRRLRTTMDEGPRPALGTSPAYLPPHSSPAAPTTDSLAKRKRTTRIGAIAVAVLASFWAMGLVRNVVRNARFVSPAPSFQVVSDSYAGINFDDDTGRELGVPGAFIEWVENDLVPAAKAGLTGGDVIVEIAGEKVESQDAATRALHRNAPGQQVDIKFLRDGQLLTTRLRIGRRGAPEFRTASRQEGFLGIGGGRRMKVPSQSIYGVRIDVIRNDPAYIAGLNSGDLIVEFNHQPVRTYRQLERLIHASTPRSPVDVVYFRNGVRETTQVVMGAR